ncbi:MAG: hypothetical protein Kow0025_19980 [Thermodesulfovibrionales bacterium]
MKGSQAEFIVGVFAMIVIAILAFMTFRVGEITLKKKAGYTVYAYFEDIAGLDEKTSVKIAGVDSGTIEKIDLIHGKARVRIRVNPDIMLYSDASAAIKAAGLLGDKYLELRIGSQKPVIGEGDEIKNVRDIADIDDLVTNLSTVSGNLNDFVANINTPELTESMKEAMVNLRDITRDLKDVISQNNARFQSVMEKVESLTASLDDLIRENREPLRETFANFRDFSGSMSDKGPQILDQLEAASRDLRTMLSENKEDVQSLVKTTESTMESLNRLTSKVERGEGTIGRLFTDESLYNSVTQAAGGLGNTVGAVDRLRTFFTFRGDYLMKHDDAKGHFYLTLQPRPDKYYILGIVSDPVGSVEAVERVDGSVVREDVKEELEFTAQFGKRFKDTTLRIGVTESTFGLGADQHFFDDKLKVSLDAWDFGENEFRAERPHLRLGADYFIFKHLFVSGGYDNFLNDESRGAFIGTGIRFEDEDFKYLFGAVPKVP